MKKHFSFEAIFFAFMAAFIVELIIFIVCISLNEKAGIIIACIIGTEVLAVSITTLCWIIKKRRTKEYTSSDEHTQMDAILSYNEIKKQTQARSDYKQICEFCALNPEYTNELPTLNDLEATPFKKYYSEFFKDAEGRILLYIMKATWGDSKGLYHPLDKDISAAASLKLVSLNGTTTKTHEVITKYPWLISPF